jgi:hypothetical protein
MWDSRIRTASFWVLLAKNTFEPFPDLATDPIRGLTGIQHNHAAGFFFRKREESPADTLMKTQSLTLDPVMPAAALKALGNVDIQNEREIRLK